MLDKIELFQKAFGLARHAASRQAIAARNVANADTPGYKAKDLAPFAQTYRSGMLDPGLKTSRSRHIQIEPTEGPISRALPDDGAVSPNGNSVSLETEMVRATDIRKQHELALSVYSTSLNILRTSLGRK